MARIVIVRQLDSGSDEVAAAVYPPEKGQNLARVAKSVIGTADGRFRLRIEVDSVGSQANRVEEEIRRARDAGAIVYPRVGVTIERAAPLPTLYVDQLQMPHRFADAILRNSDFFDEEDRKYRPHPLSTITDDLTCLLQWSPLSLLMGIFQSMQAPQWKLPRLFASVVVAHSVARETPSFEDADVDFINTGAQKTGPILEASRVSITSAKGIAIIKEAKSANKMPEKKARLSTIGLGDIPRPARPVGTYHVEQIEQRISLNTSAIARYSFPYPDPASHDDTAIKGRNDAGRALLLSLANLCVALLLEAPMDYRVGCHLVPKPGTMTVSALDDQGNPVGYDVPSVADAIDKWNRGLEAAKNHGITLLNFTAKANKGLRDAASIAGKDVVISEKPADEIAEDKAD